MTQKVQKILYSRSKHLEIAIVLVHIAYESQQKLVFFSQDFEFHDDVGQTEVLRVHLSYPVREKLP